MSFRPYYLGIIVLATIFIYGETFVPAQTTDFAAWKDADNADNVPDWVRRMLARDFRDLTGTAREELLDKHFSALKDIAADSDVVPSTRYNAMLAVGLLDSSPGNPPIAYPAALPYLVEIYQQEDIPHYLKYGALLGIVRHAFCGIESAQQDKVIDLLLETAMTEFEPTEVVLNAAPLEPEVWDWFRLTALDGLTAMKTVGTDDNVAIELLALINRKSQKLENLGRSLDSLTQENWQQIRRTIALASKAAKTLGDLDYKSATEIDAEKMTDVLITLTKAVCDILSKIADSVGRDGASINSSALLEQIVLNAKVCTQSVVWGMRSGLMANRPNENSFYASLEDDDPAIKRLDTLMAEIIELTTFFDEGEKTRRSVAVPNQPKEFRFDLLEIRDALAKCSEVLETIQTDTKTDATERL